jgi:DNA-binding MarR family transcriptional regulator
MESEMARDVGGQGEDLVAVLRAQLHRMQSGQIPELSLRSHAVLLICSASPPGETTTDLAAALNLSRADVMRAVARLRDLGLLLRATESKPPVSNRILASSKGQALVRRLTQSKA